MAITKIQSESLNLADTYAFTGTVTGAGETLKPSFRAKINSTQNVSSSTWVKVQFDTELFDTDNMYDNSTNYRFTPTTAGKYLVFASIRHDWSSNWGNNNFTAIYKNGTQYIVSDFYGNGSGVQNYGVRACTDIIDFNGTSDYVEVFGQSNSSGTQFHPGGTFFGAFKLF